MSEHHKEDLSAFMDGELTDKSDPLVNRLLKDDALRQAWMQYHLIGDAMKQSLPPQLTPGLADAVSERLREEPTVLQPARNRSSTWARPVAGLAIAASVAAVAIISIQPQQQTPAPGVSVDAPELAAFRPNIPPARQFSYPVRTASIDSSAPVTPSTTVADDARQELDYRLNYYLVNYNEYHADAGMHGMLPYVRMVAHDNND